jgi:transposase
MRIAPVIELKDVERIKLGRICRSRNAPAGEALRARVVLLAADGLQNTVIADQLGVSRVCVTKWRQRFVADRMAGLKDAPRPGRPRTISIRQIELVVSKTINEKPKDRTHWSVRSMAKETGISKTKISLIWQAHELKPHLESTFKLSKDPHFTEKLRDVVGLYMSPPANAVVLSVDEKTQIQALDRTQPGLPFGRGRNGTRTHDYVRNGTCCLFAALNALSGTVISNCTKKHDHKDFLGFLNQVDNEVESDLDVHLILDNYSTHKHQKVKDWLEKHPRFHFHFIPTSSSWLNIVERFFGKITDERIRRGAFRSVPELIDAIDSYIQNHNENPNPFIWTKTADQIIEKLKPIYSTMNMKMN